MKTNLLRFAALLAAILIFGAPLTGFAVVFSNSTAITIPGTGTGAANPGAATAPYGTSVSVSGVSGNVTAITLTLNGLTHTNPDDLDILLVSPTGARLVVLSDAGGGGDATNFTITISDATPEVLDDTGEAMVNGANYKPVNYLSTANTSNNDNWPAPASAPSGTTTFASAFVGTAPNGTWTLYIIDDAVGDVGSMSGWSLDITGAATAHSTATTVTTTDPDYELTGNSITFTADVDDTIDGDSVGANGTVTFFDGATQIGGPTALNASGQASFTTTLLAIGNHNITATYNPTAAFTTSSGSVFQVVDGPTSQAGNTFSNVANIQGPPIGVNAIGIHGPYSSHIAVSGLGGTISALTVRLNGVTQTTTDDLDVLLVSPDGTRNLVVMSDAGTGGASGVNLTFSDTAAAQINDGAALATGTFKPSNLGGGGTETYPAPAPAASAQTTLAGAFNGASPNGVWRLYVVDDAIGDIGSIASGWSLTFATSATEAPTATVLTDDDADFATTGQNITFTATATSSGNPVTTGTVTFREGATILMANVALNASGVATYSSSALAIGTHIITADYNGVPGSFGVSSGTDTQLIDYPTTGGGSTFSNTGSRAIPAPGLISISNSPSEIYPTHIVVTGFTIPINTVAVTISGLTHTNPDDLEFLLVGPSGQSVVLISDVGASNDVNAITLTLSDAAASSLPDAGQLVTGTFKPTDIGPNDPLPSPAPAPPYTSTTLGIYNNTSANGTWRLYIADDAGGDIGSITGWSLTITPLNVAPTLSNISKSGNEDTQIAFAAANFDAGFSDANAGDTLQTVRVTSLPANGTLKLSGVNVTVNQDIPRANLGNLTFDPAGNFNGSTSFGWTGSDGALFAASGALVNINIAAVNDAPAITGNFSVATPEETARTIVFGDLIVTDVDNTYPTGFTLTVMNGTNYTRVGNAITPVLNFNGILTVPVKVNDGAADSNTFNLSVTVTPVNDAPIITGQFAVSTTENTARTIVLGDLTVTDIDNTYPIGFTLTVMNGVNYTRVGNAVTPALGFVGTLTVPVQVNDGAANSNLFNLTMTVDPTPAHAAVSGTIVPEPGGGFRIGFRGSPGVNYTIQFTNSLVPAPIAWQFLGTATAGSDGRYSIVDIPPANTPMRFYRSVLPYRNNFNAGLGTATVRGSAVWANQAVQLTDAIGGQVGAVVLDGIVAGPALSGFTAKFSITTGPTTTGTPADGISFAVGDLGAVAWGENGPVTPHILTVAFDTYENGAGIPEALGIRLLSNGTVLAYNATNPYTNAVPVPVEVSFDIATGATVKFNGATIFTNVAAPGFSFQAGDRFGFGGRTGGLDERNVIDDVEITPR